MRVLKDLAGIIGPLLAILAGMALLLRGANSLPSLWRGEMGGEVEHFKSVRELEVRLGTPLLLPSYFPDYLAWPPSRLELYHWPETEIRIFISSQQDQRTRLIIYQLFSDKIPLPPDPGLIVAEKQIVVRGQPGQLAWIRTRAGEEWCRLRWQRGQHRTVLLAELAPAEVVRIAQSMRAQ